MRVTREIKYTPLASQQRFHGITARFKGFSGPVGSGKSLCLVHEAIKLSYINHGLLGLIGAPTYPMLRDVTHRAFMEVLERHKIPHRYFKQENRIHMLDTGSDIIFRSMDNPKSLVGTNLAWFGVDEMTFTEREAFHRLQARLRHPQAARLCGFGVWTPNSFDWVYDDFIGPSKKYEAILATPRENKYVVAAGLYDELAKSYDAKFAAQEIEGQYLAVFSGRVYHAFDRSVHVQPVRYDKRLDLCWALDFNIDPMSSVIFQVDPGSYLQPATVHVIDEISLKGGHTQDACSEFKRKLEEMRGGQWNRTNIKVYGDPSGNSRQHAGPSDWEAVWNEFRSYPNINMIRCVEADHPHVKDRVNAANAMLLNSQGKVRVTVDERCKELIADFEQCVWATDSNDRPIGEISKRDKRRTHMSDAIGYFFERDFGLSGHPTGPQQTVIG